MRKTRAAGRNQSRQILLARCFMRDAWGWPQDTLPRAMRESQSYASGIFLSRDRAPRESSIMFTRIICCVALLGSVNAMATEEAKPAASPLPQASGTPMEFDSFIVVLLVRPPNAPERPKAELDQLGEGHMATIRRLADEGKLLKAGPFEDFSGRNVRGMFILKTDSVDQAREWVATDPVKAGRLAPEFLKWYVQKGSLKRLLLLLIMIVLLILS
jgi:uncharacterized protein YciI